MANVPMVTPADFRYPEGRVIGFHNLNTKDQNGRPELLPVTGYLVRSTEWTTQKAQKRVRMLHVDIEDKDKDYVIHPGYSGSPVIDVHGKTVCAVVSHRKGSGGEKGYVISIDELKHVWPACPPILFADQNLESVLDTTRPPPEPSLEGLLNDLLVRIADDDNKYKDLLRGAFHQIATPEWSFSGSLDRVELFNQVIESVRTQPHPHLRDYSGDERVIIFTEILIHELPEPTVQGWRAWIDSFAEAKDIPPERVCELRNNLNNGKLKPVDPAPMESYPSLLIKIKNHPRLLLDACLWKSRQDIYPLETDRVFEPQELSDILPELLDKSLCYISGETHILCIEFFVPHEFYLERKLFPRRLDNLEIEWGLDEQHLGTYYRVVVRSLERIEGKYVERLRDRWLEKWKSFLGNIDEYIKAQHNPVATPKSIAGNYQNLDAHLLDRNVLGLALSHGSFSGCGIKPQKLFKKMLVTGIPIALWIEPDENHYLPTPDQQIMAELDDLEQALEAIATAKNLPGLVSLVKEKRREARTQNRQLHIGSFLTLFWDDPDRIPEFPEADSQVSASET
jgi:hypothetical protein